MLNEDDLRPGDLLQDRDGDFWHVHEDGKLWCSEPDSRIGFEYAKLCGPFTYAPGCDPKRDENAGERTSKGDLPVVEKCSNDGWEIRPYLTERSTRWCFDTNDAEERAKDAEDEARYWRAVAEAIKQATDPVEALADKFKNAAQSAVRVVVESLEPVVPGLKFADVDGLLADVSPEHWRTMARNVLDSSGGFDE